jgi:NADH-quinone oxidoreductase subunit N
MPPKVQTLETIAHTVQGYAALSVNGFAPELILGVGFLISILLDAVTRKAPSKRFSLIFAAIVLAIAGVFAAMQWRPLDLSNIRGWIGGFLVFPYTQSLSNAQSLLGPRFRFGMPNHGYAMAVVDNFSVFFKLLVSVAGILVLLMSLASRKLREQPRRFGEYSSLILGMSIGFYLMPASMDLVMMYVSMELASIAGYLLAGFFRDTEHGAEASLKYILFGALSSGLMIYGFSLFYGIAGTTNIIAVRQVLALNPATHSAPNMAMLWTATSLVLVGMGYKINAVPFHFWTPDVYEGAPIPVTAYLSVASKAAGFGMLIRFLFFIFPDGAKTGLPLLDWHIVVAIGAVLTMTFGNLAALLQSNVRRMLAYSTIAHSGYMLAALATGKAEGIVAIVIYLTTYLFMQLGAFYAVMLIENKIGSEEIDDYRGLMLRAPIVCSALVIFLVSLTGIPLTAGFVGKFYLLTTLLSPDAHLHTVPWLWLGIAVLLNSVMSLYYYLRVAAAMFLRRPIGAAALERMAVDVNPPRVIRFGVMVTAFLILLIVPVIALGVYFQPLVDFASGVVRFFNFDNLRY